MLSYNLCILLCTCFLLLSFSFILRKSSCITFLSSLSLLKINIYLLLICHKLYWGFLRHFFSFNTKLFHHSHLANLPMYHYKIYFYLLNSVNLSFTLALPIKFSSYFLINNVILFDHVLNFETQTMSQILELI